MKKYYKNNMRDMLFKELYSFVQLNSTVYSYFFSII